MYSPDMPLNVHARIVDTLARPHPRSTPPAITPLLAARRLLNRGWRWGGRERAAGRRWGLPALVSAGVAPRTSASKAMRCVAKGSLPRGALPLTRRSWAAAMSPRASRRFISSHDVARPCRSSVALFMPPSIASIALPRAPVRAISCSARITCCLADRSGCSSGLMMESPSVSSSESGARCPDLKPVRARRRSARSDSSATERYVSASLRSSPCCATVW